MAGKHGSAKKKNGKRKHKSGQLTSNQSEFADVAFVLSLKASDDFNSGTRPGGRLKGPISLSILA
jgi:hypothetical protein